MVEEAISGALKNFNSTLMGSVLIIFMALSGFAFRFLNNIIIGLKAELEKEREDHEKTRVEHKADIRNLMHVANSVDGMTRSVDRLNIVVEAIGRNRA